MRLHYLLDENHRPVVELDVRKWAKAWEAQRFVADEEVGGVRVATIFLGHDVNGADVLPGVKPKFFESHIFGGRLHGEEHGYETYEEAMTGHRALVDKVKKESI